MDSIDTLLAAAALRLRKRPDRTPVWLTVNLSSEHNQALLDYAALYGEVCGQAEPLPELIPEMPAGFLDADKAFARWRREQGGAAS